MISNPFDPTFDLAAGDITPDPNAELLTITHHDRFYSMYDTGGKISKAMRRGVPYEHGLLEEIWRRSARGEFPNIAIDVGASIGNHTLWMSVVCGLSVAAIEPLTTDMLQANLELNGVGLYPPAVTVHKLAAGATESRYVHEGKGVLVPWLSRANPPPPNHPSLINVTPLDDLLLPPVSLIKIDVEGMEADVLRGARRMISRDRPVIYTEFWDEGRRADIESVLSPFGYRLTRVFEMGTDLGCWESV